MNKPTMTNTAPTPVPRVLASLAIAAGSASLFLVISGLVAFGETHGLDERLMLLLRTPGDLADPIGPPWFESAVRDVTSLGGSAVLFMLVFVVAGYLALTGERRLAWFAVLGSASGAASANIMKLVFDRPRPDLVPHAVDVASLSYPSQHAMMAAVVYLTLGALIARLHKDRRVKLYVMGVACLMTALVGISRVYLGVHWPTDVLAGWALGASWAAVVWWLGTRASRRAG